MKELVEVIAKSLVDSPEEVVVTETEENDAILLELKVAPCGYGESNWPPGPHCQSYPYCGKGRVFQR